MSTRRKAERSPTKRTMSGACATVLAVSSVEIQVRPNAQVGAGVPYPPPSSLDAKRAWFAVLDERLRTAHQTPAKRLGNHADPLDECIYIILSFQTDVPRARAVWRALKRCFPTWDSLLRAPAASVARVLQPGGLHRQKAVAIRRLLRQVRSEFGTLSLGALRELDDVAAERALTDLHGLSWKGARCVMMYSLGRPLFPVDVNAFRILKRMGALPRRAVYRRKRLHDGVQEWVPEPARRSLHINLVVHGQDVCLPVNPRCSSCAVASMCRTKTIEDQRKPTGDSEQS
jgi:endonuclease-3